MFLGLHSENFRLDPNTDHWELVVVTNLLETVFQTENALVLTIEATSDDLRGSAALLIKLPLTETTTPSNHFSSNVYTGHYQSDNSVILEEEIKILGDSLDQITLSLSGGEDFKS